MINFIRAKLEQLRSFFSNIMSEHMTRDDMRHFDWPLLIIVVAITLFGIVCVFSATSSEVTSKPANVVEMVQTQSLYYPGYQFLWLIVGLGCMAAMMYLPYKLYGKYSTILYVANVAVLVLTLGLAEVGRGGMQAFVKFGSSDRGFQPSELGKSIMIICLAKTFSSRTRRITKLKEVFLLAIYAGIPIVLVALQPDVGTAMVYAAVFAVLIFVSGIDTKLLVGCILAAIGILVLGWTALNNIGDGSNFRMTRIYIWLNPEAYPDEARQVINAQIAVGSGGLFGKGIVSPGSFASLGYISDDHTDFIFAIVCESFGLVGGCCLIAAYILLIFRMCTLALRVRDPFGAYIIMGVVGMYLFHIVENIGMVIGLTPVTGIPLPFVSYGGSNMLTNMLAIGLVENVVVRSRKEEDYRAKSPAAAGIRL